MRNTIKTVLILFTLLWGTISYAQSNNFRMEIKENRGDCQGVAKQKCYLVKYHNSKDWEFFYATLENFNYEEGHRYRVLVKRTAIPNPPADAPSYRYEVLKVLKKTTVKTQNNETAVNNQLNFLDGKKWKLIQLQGKDVAKYNAFLTFDIKEKRVSGNSSCNNFFGPVTFKGNTISFGAIGATMKACVGDTIEQDVFKLFDNKGLTYDIAEQTFNLYQKDKLIAIFGLEK